MYLHCTRFYDDPKGGIKIYFTVAETVKTRSVVGYRRDMLVRLGGCTYPLTNATQKTIIELYELFQTKLTPRLERKYPGICAMARRDVLKYLPALDHALVVDTLHDMYRLRCERVERRWLLGALARNQKYPERLVPALEEFVLPRLDQLRGIARRLGYTVTHDQIGVDFDHVAKGVLAKGARMVELAKAA